MLITCVMRHARLQKLQRFRRQWPFYVFLFYGFGTKAEIARYKAGTAQNKKKLNSYFVVQAAVQQAEPEVLDTCTVHTHVDKPSQIGNNQSHADPVAQEELDNTATVDEDVDINSYTQDATELETNVNKHHFINSDTQDVEWSDCESIRTEKEFTWTVR